MSRTKMKRRWKYPVLLFALIAGWAPARDAPAEQAVSWSLRDAINYSLGHNPDLAVAHSRIEERQQQAGEVFAGFLPNLSVESGYSYLDNVPRVQIRFTQDIPIPNVPPLDINKDVDIGANDNYRAQLELSQLLFASGRVFYAHRAAKKRVRVSQLEEDAARLKTALRTAEAYYGALIADSYLAVQQEALATAQAHLEQVKNRHEAGAATRLQLLRAEVEVSNLEPRVTEAKKNGRLARILLRRATGLAEEVPIVLMDTLEAHVTEVALEGELERAQSLRPEIRALAASREATEDLALSERGGMLPTLALNGSYGTQKPYFAIDDWEEVFTVGVGLHVPLFDGLSAYRSMRRARAAAKTLNLSTAQTLADIRTEVRTKALNMQEAAVRIDTTSRNRERVERMAEISESSYTAGAATSLEVIDAQLAATRARLEHLRAIYDYCVAEVQLTAATGDLTSIGR